MNMQYSKTSKIKSGIFHVLNMKEGKKMKKSFLLLVSMVLLILLAGCNTAGPEQTQPAAQPTESTVQETLPQILPITCEPAEPVEYSAVMAALTQKRQDQLAIAGDWSGLQAYVGEEVNLVTAQEWKKLINLNSPRNEFVTYDEAAADIDLLFRVYEEAYGLRRAARLQLR